MALIKSNIQEYPSISQVGRSPKNAIRLKVASTGLIEHVRSFVELLEN